MSSPSIVEVAIALVWRDGRLLIARRPEGTHLAGLWEFPGGKTEPGETPAECIAREMREEMGIEVEVGDCGELLEFSYPERHVRIYPFTCRLLAGEPEARGCAELRWVAPTELAEYPFPPANAPLIDRLKGVQAFGRSGVQGDTDP